MKPFGWKRTEAVCPSPSRTCKASIILNIPKRELSVWPKWTRKNLGLVCLWLPLSRWPFPFLAFARFGFYRFSVWRTEC
jgi:hypothetical protein